MCELLDFSLYTCEDPSKNRCCVLGEIVIDSTAVLSEVFNSILSLRFGDFLSFRLPNETYDSIRRDYTNTDSQQIPVQSDLTFPYEMYSDNNLKPNIKTKGGSPA